MSQQYLLGTTDLDQSILARVGVQDSVDSYASIIEEVRLRCGEEVASLFAEPVRGYNRITKAQNVTWFCSYEGTPFPFTQLDAAALRPVGKLLRERLQALSTLFSDPKLGPTLASWLYVNSPADLVSVAGQPVFKNWGMVPASTANSDEAREAVFRRTTEPYAPRMPIPPFNNEEAQSFLPRLAEFQAQQESLASRSSIAGPEDLSPELAVAADQPTQRTTARLSARSAGRAWLAPALATLCALVVLIALNAFDMLRYPQPTSQDLNSELEEGQRATNNALKERLDQLKSANKNVCQMVPGAKNPPGAYDFQKLLPIAPERTPVQTAPRDGRSSEPTSVAALLDSATVLVLNGKYSGSGFFLSDRYVVTNHHVVGDSADVKIGNKALGGFFPAKVVAVGRGRSRGTQDLAVLEVEPRAGSQSLRVSVVPDRLKNVTAAGFPGAVTSTEQLTSPENLPEANFTSGIVTSHQNQKPDGVGTIIHTAQIGHGNSGGPLIDEGGCVVGVNSWLSFDGDDSRNYQTYNQSIDADELRKFLNGNGIAFSSAESQCSPAPQPVSKQASPAPPPKN
jgi:S1-C subfamily serine protease